MQLTVRCICDMNKVLLYPRVLFKEYVTAPGIYIAVVLFILLCLFGCLIPVGTREFSVLEILTNRSLYEQACGDLNCNSYVLTYGYDISPWFSVLAPIITGFPAFLIYKQNAEGVRPSILNRMNLRTYTGSLFCTAFLSGCFIALFGIILYGGLIRMTFPPITACPDEFVAMYGSTTWERFLPLLKKCVNCCIACGFFPVLTILLYQVIHDKFLAITLPMVLQYISFKGEIAYSTWYRSLWVESLENGTESSFPSGPLDLISLLFPSRFMDYHTVLGNSVKLPFACFFVVAGLVFIILYYIFKTVIRFSIGEKI